MEEKSLVMTRAAELRSEGYDPSEALTQAWSEIEDEDDSGIELVEATPKRRRSRTGANPIMLLLVASAGYLGWCWYAQLKSGTWSWTPWKTPPMSARRIAALMAKPAVLPPVPKPQPDVQLIIP